MNLKIKIGRIELKNPICVASGTFGYGEEFHKDYYDISKLGAVFTKGISLRPREGNSTPRVVETYSGMLNAIGLQNVGLEKFLSDKLPFLKKVGATTIVNIFGATIDEYAELAGALDKADGVAGVEVNISCPNVKQGGVQFGIDPKLAAKVTKAVRKKTDKTVIVKLSPNYHNIPEMARAVEKAGADALSCINTITGMAIDIKTKKPVLANIVGGLSGPAIKPVALRMVWEAANALKGPVIASGAKQSSAKSRIPIIGCGGIMNINDVIEFLLAGATAIQVGTANFIKPTIANELIGQLEQYLGNKDVSELIGGLDI